MFGFGRPQPSSAEKVAAAEQEMDMITDMFNKYIFPPFLFQSQLSANILFKTSTILLEEMHTENLP